MTKGRLARRRWTALGILGLATGLLLPAAPSHAAAQRNLVVVMTDDQTVAQLRYMPTVSRRLAAKGTTFTNSFSVFPFCCPSRATFLTGQYPHNHGVRDQHPKQRDNYRVLDPAETLPVWLRRAGYRTAHVGKYLNGYGQAGAEREVPPGWSEWVAPVDHTELRYYDYTLNVNGALERHGSRDSDYQADVLARHAVDFVRDHAPGNRPFFLSVAPAAPHDESDRDCSDRYNPRPAPRHQGRYADVPLPRPPSFDESDVSDKPAAIRTRPRVDAACLEGDWRSELESLLAVDELVRKLLRAVNEAGDIDRTVIVFTSDNGLLHGEHRAVKAKRLPYEESIRVPLVIRGPGFARARRDELAANVDLAPTLLELADARPGRGHTLDGRSLVAPRNRAALLLEERHWTALRTADHLYVRYREGSGEPTGEEELYDLRVDPFELQSLHADPLARFTLAAMRSRLASVEECEGNGCP